MQPYPRQKKTSPTLTPERQRQKTFGNRPTSPQLGAKNSKNHGGDNPPSHRELVGLSIHLFPPELGADQS